MFEQVGRFLGDKFFGVHPVGPEFGSVERAKAKPPDSDEYRQRMTAMDSAARQAYVEGVARHRERNGVEYSNEDLGILRKMEEVSENTLARPPRPGHVTPLKRV